MLPAHTSWHVLARASLDYKSISVLIAEILELVKQTFSLITYSTSLFAKTSILSTVVYIFITDFEAFVFKKSAFNCNN